MSIGVNSTLRNSSRSFKITVDKYDNREPYGIISHDRFEEGIAYKGLVSMIKIIESILVDIGYAKEARERRYFSADINYIYSHEELMDMMNTSKTQEDNLGEFDLHITRRYNATWQGDVICSTTSERKETGSFLELIEFMDGVLEERAPVASISHKQNNGLLIPCRVAIDAYTQNCAQGSICQAYSDREIAFRSGIELMRELVQMLDNQKQSADKSILTKREITSSQVVGIYNRNGQLGTFIIKLMFEKNNTWQGNLFWREENKSINFKSFLELIMMIDNALESK